MKEIDIVSNKIIIDQSLTALIILAIVVISIIIMACLFASREIRGDNNC